MHVFSVLAHATEWPLETLLRAVDDVALSHDEATRVRERARRQLDTPETGGSQLGVEPSELAAATQEQFEHLRAELTEAARTAGVKGDGLPSAFNVSATLFSELLYRR